MSIKLFNANLDSLPEIIASKDQWLIDRNGNKLFDTWLGSGTLIFGHEKASEIKIDMLPHGVEFDHQIRNLFSKLVDFEVGGIGLQTSGSSAITRAIRLARSITNRDKIAVVGDFWHGSDGDFLFKMQKQKISPEFQKDIKKRLNGFPA